MQAFLPLLVAILAATPVVPALAPREAGKEDRGDRQAVLAFLRARLAQFESGSQTDVIVAPVSLHPGPERQFVVVVEGRDWCGTGGCNTLVLERSATGVREVASISVTRTPILALQSRTNGWRDLSVRVRGYGDTPGYQALLSFDGQTYAGNPTVPPGRQLPAEAFYEVLIEAEARGQPLFAGPSFDCAKAATKVERSICATPVLASLDLGLADQYHFALEGRPGLGGVLEESQVAWLKHRDRSCAEGNARCLEWLYTTRLAELSDPPERLALPLCRAVAERARTNPVELLPLASSIRGPEAWDLAGWNAWGRGQSPPIEFDDAFFPSEAWLRGAELHRVPGTPLYGAATVEGTGRCWSVAFFRGQGGLAEHVDGPPAWSVSDPPGMDCGVLRGFALVEGASVAVEVASPSDLEERLSLSRWDGAQFGQPCEIRLNFRPTFGPPSSDTLPELCGAEGCGPLREAAAGVVEEIYRVGTQRIDGPFRRKRLVAGEDYAVAASRAKIGWRTFSAWEVTFQRLDGKGEVRKVVVDVGRGPVRDVSAW